MGLLNIFDKTKLDMTDPKPNGGAPINVPANNHSQKWRPDKKFVESKMGIKGLFSNLLLNLRFGLTKYDMTNPNPNQGAQINVPNNGHSQRWTPRKEFDKFNPQAGPSNKNTSGYYKGTKYDIQVGGPTNVTTNNHKQNWTNRKQYQDNQPI